MRNYRSILKIWITHFLIYLTPKRIITFHFISKLKYCKKKLLYGELAHPVLWNIWSSPLLVAKQGYFPSKQQSESYQSGLLPGWPACTNGLVWFHFRRALARFPDDCDVFDCFSAGGRCPVESYDIRKVYHMYFIKDAVTKWLENSKAKTIDIISGLVCSTF